MSRPKVIFATLATVATMATAQAQLRMEPKPGGATSTVPAGPQAMQLPPAMAERIRTNSNTFANDVALAGMVDLREFIADKNSACSDLTSLYKSQQEILANQRAISRDPAMRAILEEELVKAKVPEATATTKAQLAKRCTGAKLD